MFFCTFSPTIRTGDTGTGASKFGFSQEIPKNRVFFTFFGFFHENLSEISWKKVLGIFKVLKNVETAEHRLLPVVREKRHFLALFALFRDFVKFGLFYPIFGRGNIFFFFYKNIFLPPLRYVSGVFFF